jgi:HNH endonuclease
MGVTQQEYLTRQWVEALSKQIDETRATSLAQIYNESLEMFEKRLTDKLLNLQIGESLQISYRIDIIDPDGKVRGGVKRDRNMPAYIEWRKSVFERDSYTCRECGAKGNINAHHIKAWSKHPEQRFDIDNGITLCGDCHAKQHPHLKFIHKRKRKITR